MERIILAAILLASIIAVNTSGDPPAARCPAVAAYEIPAVMAVPPVPPVPPMPPMPVNVGHPDFDFDFDFDSDGINQVISRELARGEKATCPVGTACDFTCDEGRCPITCAPGSVCSTQCDGGACSLACAAGAVCDFQCDGGACPADCAEGSVCSVTDDEGRTTTHIRNPGRHGHGRRGGH